MICKPCALGVDMIDEMRKTNQNYFGSSYVMDLDGGKQAIDDKELFFRTAINFHSFCKKNCDCNHNINMDGETVDERADSAPRKITRENCSIS